jgi:RND family efflux transporter MFP subunit
MNKLAAEKSSQRKHPVLSKVSRAAVPVAILLVGWFSYQGLSVGEEEAKAPPEKQKVIKTTVAEIELQNYQTIVTTRGIVRPHNEVTLNAEVTGKIVRVSPNFEDGAYFGEDEVLLELDDSDFKTAVLTAEAQVARAAATLAQEEARAKQARLNWEDLGYDEEPNDLVLRLPQLREAQANVKSSTALLAQAQRDLERTRIRAPFEGRVRMRSVGRGQSVGTGTPLGTIFATDYAEVRLPLSSQELSFLTLPDGTEDSPVAVELRDAIRPDSETVWKGEIVRTEGALDEDSLELFAIARIPDPFGLKSDHLPLPINQPVSGAIQGRVLEDVYVVPRKAIREVDRIYLVNKQTLTLERHVIEAIWSEKDHVVIRSPGMFDGSYLATSRLSYTPDEAKVEIISHAEKTVQDSEQVTQDAKAKKQT